MEYIVPIQRLIEKFASLKGVGRKTAARYAFAVLDMTEEEATDFANAIIAAKNDVMTCSICGNMSDKPVCDICADDRRDKSVICVVEDPRAVIAFENTREYNGLYHVLHGVLSPIGRIGPDDLRIAELIKRVADEDSEISEVIMATNPDTEGDATAMYISRLLKPFDVKVTRLAYGIPVGSNLEFADDATLLRAIEGRIEM